jgi:hypothetical protein
MDKEALSDILQTMNKDLSGSVVEVGKLYWVRSKDDGIKPVGYEIKKLGPDQKRSYHLNLLGAKELVSLVMNRRQTDKDKYPVGQPILLLKTYTEKYTEPITEMCQTNDDRGFIDILVGDKKYKRVVYSPLEIEWKLVLCQPES